MSSSYRNRNFSTFRRGVSQRSNRNFSNRISNKLPNSIKNMVRDGPSVFARTLYNVQDLIPEHTANPRVTRVIRIYSIINNTTATIPVSYGSLGTQDSTDYGVSAFRYQFIRVKQCKVWLEVPNGLSVSVTPPSLIITESVTGYKVSDRGIAGSRYAKAGMEFSWGVQQGIVATNSAVNIFTVSTDITIPTNTNIPVTIDVVTEFL